MTEGQHGPNCPCPRCRGFAPGNEFRFEEGNDAAATHGVYSPRRLTEAAQEEYATLREVFIPWDPMYELPVRSLAETRAMKRLAVVWLDEHGMIDEEGNARGIVHELPKWTRRETELFREMAITVRSRVELDLDRLARERDLIELAEVNAFRSAVLEVVSSIIDRITVGELNAADARQALAAELRSRAELAVGGRDVEGSARRVGDEGERSGA